MMALTGVRGPIVVTTITLPILWLYVMMVTVYPDWRCPDEFRCATVMGCP